MTNSSNTQPRLVIVGLGLMGASLAMAVRGKYFVTGVARRAETVAQALNRNIVDEATQDFRGAVAAADIIVLATPVRTVVAQLAECADLARIGAVITDLGSTKLEIVRAMDQLPEHLAAVGSHPMCGKETAGMDVAEAGLYHGRPWLLTRTKRTTEQAFCVVEELARAAGARTIELDAERHDATLAISSHLPYSLALALMTTAERAGQDNPDVFRVMAGGFRDTSRVAASDEVMWTDILLSNARPVADAIRDFQFQLDQLTALIERKDESGLRDYLGHAARARRQRVNVI